MLFAPFYFPTNHFHPRIKVNNGSIKTNNHDIDVNNAVIYIEIGIIKIKTGDMKNESSFLEIGNHKYKNVSGVFRIKKGSFIKVKAKYHCS